MLLYYRTTESLAVAILTGGFRNAMSRYRPGQEYAGIWLADCPPAAGAYDVVLLAVDLALPGDVFREFEWTDADAPSREFLIPARLINANATVQRVED